MRSHLLVMATFAALALAACGEKAPEPAKKAAAPAATTPAPQPPAAPTPAPEAQQAPAAAQPAAPAPAEQKGEEKK